MPRMTETPILRVATKMDIPSLQTLYRHLIPDEDSAPPDVAAARLEALAAFPGSAILLAEVAGQAVSTLTLIVVPNMTRQGAPYAFIENVVTHADHRGQGHATALLAEAEARAWAVGCYRIMIVSGDHNTGAHMVYEAAGFAGTKIGFQKRRPPDRGL